jgi:lipoprotein-releasing system ATP-binding protein
MLTCNNIYKSYGNISILKDVSIEVQEGTFCAIVGPSGAGKSTLLHIAGTLDKPDRGHVKLGNTHMSSLTPNKLANFRNKHIGFVFQFHYLLPEFSALENVCMPAWIGGNAKSDIKAKELLDFFGLSHRMDAMPSTLSGGEQQRVAIARALINDPLIIFADEPTGNLDSERSAEIHALFLQLKNTFSKTLVVVTHNESLANQADQIVHLVDGIIQK